VELNLSVIMSAIAAATPERECLVFGERRLTWEQFMDRARSVAAVLAEHGLSGRDRGTATGWESTQDHVALYLHNGNEYLEAMIGSYAGRCAPVNINYRYRSAELSYVLRDSRSRAIVYHASFGPTLAEIIDDLDDLELLLCVDDGSGVAPLPGAIDYERALADAGQPTAPPDPSPDDLYICYTGGTTGMPKGVLWRQADFLVSALGVRQRSGEDYDSVDQIVAQAIRGSVRALPAPPLMHGAAHWNAISAWISGGTVIIQDRPQRFDPADIWSTIDRESATSLLIVGDAFATPLIDEWDRAANESTGYSGASLRHILSGGAILSPTSKAALLERLPQVTIVDVLGSSESGRQGVAQQRRDQASAESSGFVASETALLLDETRSSVLDTSDSSIGWLAQSGRVPLGYLGDRDKTEATFPVVDGQRLAVAGDRARYEHQRIVLLGRESVTINTGGEKVFAEEVEVALSSHSAVFDVVVCGRPSDRWGQEIVAVISLRPGHSVTDDELRAHCRRGLADFKSPRAVVRVPVVERSPSGKADYAWAREMATPAPENETT